MTKIGKVDQGVIHVRHMICPGVDRKSEDCRQCYHGRVHDEKFTCKACICGHECTPVTEANS